MSIAETVRKAYSASFAHLGTDVKVLDELDNGIAIVRAIVSKQESSDPFSGAVINQYQIKFNHSELPQHRSGLKIHAWRGNFSLFTVIDKNETTVTYSLQQD